METDSNSQKPKRSTVLMSLANVIFLLASFIACSYQIFQLGKLYFNYGYTTDLNIESPTRYKSPGTSICFRYTDLISEQFYRSQLGENFVYNTTDDVQVRGLMSNFTLEQIFANTPAVEDVFASCEVRAPKSLNLKIYSGKECLELFDIQKFYTQQFMCYLMNSQKEQNFVLKQVAKAITSPNLLYMLGLNCSSFETMDVFKAIVYNSGGYPSRSITYAPSMRRKYVKRRNELEPVWYDLTSSNVQTQSLPAPYKPNCRNYSLIGFANSIECRTHCLTSKAIDELGKVPFKGMFTRPYKLKHISPEDIANEDIEQRLRKFEAECERTCPGVDCVVHYSMTAVKRYPRDESVAFLISGPLSPDMFVQFVPQMTIVEFLTYFLSTLGAWFGISVLSLRPSNLLQKRWLVRTIATSGQGSNCSICEQNRSIVQRNQRIMFRQSRDIGELRLRVRDMEISMKRVAMFSF